MTGFGVSRKQINFPAATGTHVHWPLAQILRLCQTKTSIDLKQPLVRAQLRKIIVEAIARYREECEAVGFANEPESEKERQLKEQSALIEGFVWGWCRGVLPSILAECEIIDVEREEALVVGCTCKGPGEQPGQVNPETGEVNLEGHAEDCVVVVHQAKPDVVLRRRDDKRVGVWDFKTMKYASDFEIAKYRTSTQMASQTRVVERRLGIEVSHYGILALLKGDRKAEYNPQTKAFDRPKIQLSRFCYVGYTPPAPPIQPEEINFDEKWYKCLPVWEINFVGKPKDVRPVEWLVMEKMPLERVQQSFAMVGPYDRQGFLIRGYFNQVYFDELRWAEVQWRIFEDVEEGATLEDALDKHVPASWGCLKFGSNYPCPMLEVCTKNGVEARDPLASGLYVVRTPHHEGELRLVKEAGVELPQGVPVTEDD